jgi:hypothetical protein
MINQSRRTGDDDKPIKKSGIAQQLKSTAEIKNSEANEENEKNEKKGKASLLGGVALADQPSVALADNTDDVDNSELSDNNETEQETPSILSDVELATPSSEDDNADKEKPSILTNVELAIPSEDESSEDDNDEEDKGEVDNNDEEGEDDDNKDDNDDDNKEDEKCEYDNSDDECDCDDVNKKGFSFAKLFLFLVIFTAIGAGGYFYTQHKEKVEKEQVKLNALNDFNTKLDLIKAKCEAAIKNNTFDSSLVKSLDDIREEYPELANKSILSSLKSKLLNVKRKKEKEERVKKVASEKKELLLNIINELINQQSLEHLKLFIKSDSKKFLAIKEKFTAFLKVTPKIIDIYSYNVRKPIILTINGKKLNIVIVKVDKAGITYYLNGKKDVLIQDSWKHIDIRERTSVVNSKFSKDVLALYSIVKSVSEGKDYDFVSQFITDAGCFKESLVKSLERYYSK